MTVYARPRRPDPRQRARQRDAGGRHAHGAGGGRRDGRGGALLRPDRRPPGDRQRRIAELTGAEAGLRHVRRGRRPDARRGRDARPASTRTGWTASPTPSGGPSEIVVQASHRNPYDHLVRASGARLVEFGDANGATADADGPRRSARRRPGAFFHGQAEADGLPIEDVRRDRPRARPAGPRRRVDEPAAARQPAPVHRGGRRSRRVQRRQDDPRPAGLGVPRRPGGPPHLGRAPAAGHGRPAGDVGPSRAARDGVIAAAADPRHRPVDEDRQGGDRRPARRPRPLRGPRRGRRDRALDGRRRPSRRRAGRDPRPDRPDATPPRPTAGRSR